MIPTRIRRQVFERDNYLCQYCDFDGRNFENWRLVTIDHLLRVADKGTNDMSNLVTACRSCNNYLNRRSFKSIAEKRQALQKKIAEERTRWDQHVRDVVRP